jgi:hypothetical protein
MRSRSPQSPQGGPWLLFKKDDGVFQPSDFLSTHDNSHVSLIQLLIIHNHLITFHYRWSPLEYRNKKFEGRSQAQKRVSRESEKKEKKREISPQQQQQQKHAPTGEDEVIIIVVVVVMAIILDHQ